MHPAARVAIIVCIGLTLGACRASAAPSPTAAPSHSPKTSPLTSTPPTIASASPKPPQLHVTQQVETYLVSGRTTAQVDRQIDQRGPGRFAGLTSYVTTWQTSSVPTDNGCQLVSPRVEMRITITLPRAAASIPSQTRGYIGSLIARLRAHENGHVRLARENGRRTLAALAVLRGQTYPTCARMRAEADRVATHEVHRGQVVQRRYDERTDHGLTQWLA